MKMFIPEIGSRIVLIENFTFSDYSGEKNIDAGVKMTVRKISIKVGRSHENSITFNVIKCKENKKSPYQGYSIKVNIVDVNEMVFEMDKCNDDTKKCMINTLDDIRTKTKGINTSYRIIERILLNKKNILVFYPQKTPVEFFKELIIIIKDTEKLYSKVISYSDLYDIINLNFRKAKISMLLE